MILPLATDEAHMVDIAGGYDGGDVAAQAHGWKS